MLRDRLNTELKEAMKAGDAATVSTLRLVNAAIKDKDIAARPAGNAGGIGEAEIMSLLQNMVKQRRESVTMYSQGNRPDLVEKEEAEITVIERYLPQQLDAAALAAAIDRAIVETGASSIKDMGKVMGVLKANHAGEIDFAAAGPLVKGKLGG